MGLTESGECKKGSASFFQTSYMIFIAVFGLIASIF